MAKFTIQSGTSVEDFFTKNIPTQFNDAIAGANLSALAGKEINLQFNVSDQSYCLKIKDGNQLEVIKGGVEKPLLTLAMSEQVFLNAIGGKFAGMFDRFMDPVELSDSTKLKNLMDSKGALNLFLKHEGAEVTMNMIFGGEAKPSVDITLELKDWIAMQNKEITGQTLFMNGKLKFSGDMALLMRLQALI